jgi:signal peptidase I
MVVLPHGGIARDDGVACDEYLRTTSLRLCASRADLPFLSVRNECVKVSTRNLATSYDLTVTGDMNSPVRAPAGPWWPSAPGQGAPRPRRRPWQVVYWVTFGLLCAAVAGLLAGALVTLGTIRPTTQTMAPAISAGNLAIFQRDASGIVRGDVVVIYVRSLDGNLVRRVIGLPGDRVACCDADGRVTVNGRALNEDYLPSGTVPSQSSFAATVGPGQVWIMADNRATAYDSRTLGPLAMGDIGGRVIEVSGSHGFSPLRTPATFTANGLAPADSRLPLPFLLVLLALLAIVALIVQGAAGVITWAVRRGRREQRPLPQPPAW